MKHTTVDVAILGNGTLGTATARTLAKADKSLKIALIGPAARTNGATGAAGAMLNCFAEVTKQTFTSAAARTKLTMAITSNQLWPAWLERLNDETNANIQLQHGTHVILNTQNGGIDDENFGMVQQALNEYNQPYTAIEPSTIHGYNPICTNRALKALYLPNELFCNSLAILAALDKANKKTKHITILDTFGQTIKQQKNGFQIKTVNQQTIIAKQILIAAGAFSQTLIDQFPEIAGQIPAVMSSIGCALKVKANDITLKSVIRTPARAGSCGIHFLPSVDDTLYIGATAYFAPVPTQHIKMRYLYNLQRNIITQFNENIENAEITDIYCGNRPVTLDTFPLLGATSIDGLWIATGTYRDGFHNTPLLSEYLASEILQRKTIALDHPFAPERKPIQTMSQAESIELATHHIQAVFYEYDATYPISGLDVESLFLERIQGALAEIYEQLKTDCTIPVEVLVMLLRAPKETLDHYRKIYQAFSPHKNKRKK